MKGFVCGVCGYIPLSGEVPEKCPVCGVKGERLEKVS